MSESFINQFKFRCVRNCLELTKPQASVRNLLNLEQYLRFVILLRYKYLYLRFLRLPPCGTLWVCPHFDQNILISQHLSFYPINWFSDKSANPTVQNAIDFLLFESECTGMCSPIGIVGKVSLVIKWLGPGNPKSMLSSKWGIALQKCISRWVKAELILRLSPEEQKLRLRTKPRDFEIEALHQEPELWEVLKLLRLRSAEAFIIWPSVAGRVSSSNKKSSFPLLKIFSVPLHRNASAENMRKSPDSELQRAKF